MNTMNTPRLVYGAHNYESLLPRWYLVDTFKKAHGDWYCLINGHWYAYEKLTDAGNSKHLKENIPEGVIPSTQAIRAAQAYRWYDNVMDELQTNVYDILVIHEEPFGQMNEPLVETLHAIKVPFNMKEVYAGCFLVRVGFSRVTFVQKGYSLPSNMRFNMVILTDPNNSELLALAQQVDIEVKE